jgi:predicted SAM-dependent methyltransferase
MEVEDLVQPAARIAAYLSRHSVAKLHVGCGMRRIPGWLNSDVHPRGEDVVPLDATAAFPVGDAVFDYVFTEHMIEHVPYEGGLNLIKESFRVLRRGGRLRISTPDMRFLVELYAAEKTPLQQAYIEWAAGRFVASGIATDTFVINNFVREWGHLFIYDAKTLRHALTEAGFVDIESYPINQSDAPALRGLEHDGRMPPGFLQLETMTMEARKP